MCKHDEINSEHHQMNHHLAKIVKQASKQASEGVPEAPEAHRPSAVALATGETATGKRAGHVTRNPKFHRLLGVSPHAGLNSSVHLLTTSGVY